MSPVTVPRVQADSRIAQAWSISLKPRMYSSKADTAVIPAWFLFLIRFFAQLVRTRLPPRLQIRATPEPMIRPPEKMPMMRAWKNKAFSYYGDSNMTLLYSQEKMLLELHL